MFKKDYWSIANWIWETKRRQEWLQGLYLGQNFKPLKISQTGRFESSAFKDSLTSDTNWKSGEFSKPPSAW
jgi:hypothetical protein